MSLSPQRIGCDMRQMLVLSAVFLSFRAAGPGLLAQRGASPTPGIAQNASPAPQGAGAGVLRGVSSTVHGEIRLIPAKALTGAASMCAEYDSARIRVARLRRNTRFAADSATRASRSRRSYWRAAADSVARGLPPALSQLTSADAAIVSYLGAQPGYPAQATGHYVINGILPGNYLVYAMGPAGSFWIIATRIGAGDHTLNLNDRNASQPAGLWMSISHLACWYNRELRQTAFENLTDIDVAKVPPASETSPELLDRGEAAKLISRGYPPQLRSMGISGSAEVSFRVRTDGTVDVYTIEIRSASDPAFGDAAALAVENLRFRPLQLYGEPASAWVVLPVIFRLQH